MFVANGYTLLIISLETCCMVCSSFLGFCSNTTLSEIPSLTHMKEEELLTSPILLLISLIFLHDTFHPCTGNAIIFYLFVYYLCPHRVMDSIWSTDVSPKITAVHLLMWSDCSWLGNCPGIEFEDLHKWPVPRPAECATGRMPIHHGVSRTL